MIGCVDALWERLAKHAESLLGVRREAERQVAAKFPSLVRDTPGWHRAVSNRYVRLLRRRG